MPSGMDFNEGVMSSDLKKYLKGKKDINAEDRVKILRLIENMTLGRNAVAYLTESLHGAGSPQAQRVQIKRGVDMEQKKDFAKNLSGVNERKKL
jgi:4-hydroxybutyryl-CoA dehydratase/vinylacetyl-CoA-Delta-isomerase